MRGALWRAARGALLMVARRAVARLIRDEVRPWVKVGLNHRAWNVIEGTEDPALDVRVDQAFETYLRRL